MNTLTRAQGYKQNAWKGKIGEEIFESFLDFYRIPHTKIVDKWENIEKGDYKTGIHYFEVKSQNIGNYNQNFVELGEITDKDYHSGGYKKLVNTFKPYNVDIENKLAYIPKFNFALTPVSNGALMVYINTQTKLLYLYTAKTFLTSVAEHINSKGIKQGLGKSNQDTIATFCMNAKVTFKHENNTWNYNGDQDLNKVLSYLRIGK